MKFRASVSLESDWVEVRTYRGEIDVANPRLGARRAAEAAFKAYPKAKWRSIVIVLEKLSSDEDEQGADEGEAA